MTYTTTRTQRDLIVIIASEITTEREDADAVLANVHTLTTWVEDVDSEDDLLARMDALTNHANNTSGERSAGVMDNPDGLVEGAAKLFAYIANLAIRRAEPLVNQRAQR